MVLTVKEIPVIERSIVGYTSVKQGMSKPHLHNPVMRSRLRHRPMLLVAVTVSGIKLAEISEMVEGSIFRIRLVLSSSPAIAGVTDSKYLMVPSGQLRRLRQLHKP